MEQIFSVHGVPQVVHADRGTSMTSKTVAALLADLEVTRSHSRPRVSNDNPYSEALFKTLKYGPEFPERFGSLTESRKFMDEFTHWYNHEHRHTGIGLHTPADVHFGLAAATTANRRTVLAEARARHPHRFGGHHHSTEDPRPTRHRLDQPASRRHRPADRHRSRLTPTDLIHLDKFRSSIKGEHRRPQTQTSVILAAFGALPDPISRAYHPADTWRAEEAQCRADLPGPPSLQRFFSPCRNKTYYQTLPRLRL